MGDVTEKIGEVVLGLFAGLLVAFLSAFLIGWFVKLLWNWLIPNIFGLGTITYWQGLGLYLLFGLLFKGSSYSTKK